MDVYGNTKQALWKRESHDWWQNYCSMVNQAVAQGPQNNVRPSSAAPLFGSARVGSGLVSSMRAGSGRFGSGRWGSGIGSGRIGSGVGSGRMGSGMGSRRLGSGIGSGRYMYGAFGSGLYGSIRFDAGRENEDLYGSVRPTSVIKGKRSIYDLGILSLGYGMKLL